MALETHPAPTPDAGKVPAKRSLWRRFCYGLTRLRRFVTNAVFLLLLLLVLGLMIGSCQTVRLPNKGGLLLNPKGAIVEQPTYTDPIRGLLNPQFAVQETAIGDLLRAVNAAKEDDRINVLILRLDELQWLSIGHAQSLGKAIESFQESDKQVVAYGHYYDQIPYLLASYADAVYMHPMGQAILPGYASFSLYYKELIDKLKVKFHIFRVGTYKSFVEPYERNSMSEPAKLANQQTLDELWQVFLDQVASNRTLQPAELRQYVHELPSAVATTGGDLARAALEANLVDELLSEDQSRARLVDITGQTPDGDFVATDYRTYLQALGDPSPKSDPAISVLTLEGNIVMSAPTGGAIAADTVATMVRQMHADPHAAALVVRVDSPGGSSFASELIRKELELVQLAGKPVVVSMGNTAASGGYWISATADAIVAEPTTITGSIGIFSIIPTFEDSLAAVGIHGDGVGTTPMSGGLHPLTGVNEPMTQVLQRSLEHGYQQFTSLVARGRDMPLAEVESLAQGRIWTGSHALQLGLVDSLGSLPEAIARAAELVGLETYSVDHLRQPRSARDLLLEQLLGNALVAGQVTANSALGSWSTNAIVAETLRWQDHLQALSGLSDPNNRMALCELCVGLGPVRGR